MPNRTPIIIRSVAILCLAAMLSLTTGCSDPTPTPTPVPTPTPTPVSIEDLEITAATTLGSIVAALTGSEAACVRNAIGAETFDAVMNVPIASAPAGAFDLPWGCLSREHAVGVAVAFMSAEAGGLSPQSRGCVRGVAMESPHVLGIEEPPAEPAAAMRDVLQGHLCLSDVEAAVLSARRGTELPVPSAIRCMEELMGGPEAMIAVLSADEPDEATAFSLFGAALACDVTLADRTDG